ncbi:hypothetical protein CVT24_006894 [Panaeolus cyanescens]|uniref:Uncharacterized protein n=1 Tax=Panaeolus cyanescens TaxID=181874 RepID=A0A409X8R8_9AGAR|nr:hypothetical protein CVT24_006894 [Panaeolus cyanescens]
MPELVEGIAHYLTTSWGLEYYKDSPRRVLGLYADFTDKEAKKERLSNDLVQELGPQTRKFRGTRGHQGDLIAPELQAKGKATPKVLIESLVLGELPLLSNINYSITYIIVTDSMVLL